MMKTHLLILAETDSKIENAGPAAANERRQRHSSKLRNRCLYTYHCIVSVVLVIPYSLSFP